jgi:hypothetical protein
LAGADDKSHFVMAEMALEEQGFQAAGQHVAIIYMCGKKSRLSTGCPSDSQGGASHRGSGLNT